MDTSAELLANANFLYTRAETSASHDKRPPAYKAVGLTLAIASGLFIGTSFVLKKTGLLKANEKYNEEAGEGYGYLKNVWWWSGMTLMIVGELCNFVAYAFLDAILVTPLGALSVVVTTILSAIFLKERLSFVGKVGCFNCIIGSIVIVLNAPDQSSVATIQDMKHFVIAPGFLSYAGVIIVGSAFIALWVGPRYGKKSMLVYLSVCSLIGGLSVVATQGLGAAIVAQAGGKPQFNQWFLYVLLVFVIATLLTEIIYLNKALNIFNAALVTPTYYVFFTSATIVTSSILFQGFKGTPLTITTVIMGFLQICAGVVLLQMSKSAKDVPDTAVFKGDLDQVREIAEQEQPETEPKADALRGTAAIIRRFSVSRQKMEEAEARRYHEEKMKEQLEPLRENEVAEWDGLRRRKTVIGETPNSPIVRRKTIHPPLGMSHFPEETDESQDVTRDSHSFFDSVRNRTQSVLHPRQARHADSAPVNTRSPIHPMALTEINVQPSKADTPTQLYIQRSDEEPQDHIYGIHPGLRETRQEPAAGSPRSKPLPSFPRSQSPTHTNEAPSPSRPLAHTSRRQFSFTNFIRGQRTPDSDRPTSSSGPRHSHNPLHPPPSRSGIGSRGSSYSNEQKKAMKTATEEERLGLVKGDSHAALLHQNSSVPTHSQSGSSASRHDGHDRLYQPPSPIPSEDDEDDDWQMTIPPPSNPHAYHHPPAYDQSPERLPQRQQSPPRAYQHQASGNTFDTTQRSPSRSKATVSDQGQGGVYNPSQPSSTNRSPTSLPDPAVYNLPSAHASQGKRPKSAATVTEQYTIGDRMGRAAGPEDYEESRRRFQQRHQQRPGLPERDKDSGATNGSGRPAFI